MKINSIYPSISGEVGVIIPQGHTCLIIRTQECNLECNYCDAPQTRNSVSGIDYSVDHLISITKTIGLPVLLTGGEPLLQDDTHEFLVKCEINEIPVQVETNGTFKIPVELEKTSFIVDHKFGQTIKVHYAEDLGKNDYVKFVVTNVDELAYACAVINSHKGSYVNWAVSPIQHPGNVIHNNITAKEITNYLIKNNIRAVLNIQIHKLLDLP